MHIIGTHLYSMLYLLSKILHYNDAAGISSKYNVQATSTMATSLSYIQPRRYGIRAARPGRLSHRAGKGKTGRGDCVA